MIEKIDKVTSLINDIDFLEDELLQIINLRDRILDEELIISVIGQFKRGKSSLINSMIGEEILPVGIIPLTTTITEIRHSNEFKVVVIFNDDSEKIVKKEDLHDYVSEQENPDNYKGVKVVKLWTDLSKFDKRMTLVDTPGVGSIHQHNTETSYSYVEKSDGVLFLLSVDSPVSEVEQDFLNVAKDHAAKFYFAVNKIDTIDKDNLEEFLKYSKDIISNSIGFEPIFFPISAITGEGISSLMEEIREDLSKSYSQMLEKSANIKLSSIINHINSKIKLYLKALSVPVEELEDKRRQIRSKNTELDKLSDEVLLISKVRTEELLESIDTEMNKVGEKLKNDLKEEMNILDKKINNLSSKEYEDNLRSQLNNLLRGKVESLNHYGLDLLNEGYDLIIDSLNSKALEISDYISGMIREIFNVEYVVENKNYEISDRSDYFIKIDQFYSTNKLVHLLPRFISNKKIFSDHFDDGVNTLKNNKVRILYNYRYKMQESLRILHNEFNKDIQKMRVDLDNLLDAVENSQKTNIKKLDNDKEELIALIDDLDKIIS